MKTTTHPRMKDLYDRLGKLGLKRKFLKDCVLPEWWEDSLAAVPANRAQVEMILARQLGLDFQTLGSPLSPLRLHDHNAKLRHRGRTTKDELRLAIALGMSVASIAASRATAGRPQARPWATAAGIRKDILSGGAQWVNFERLLDYCWESGLPVIQITHFPESRKKMDGMAAMAESRPVLIIGSQRRQPAWHLFLLAHELGHVVLGHVRDSGTALVDSEMAEPTSVAEEKLSDRFALELLTGNPDARYEPAGRWLTAEALAKAAQAVGEETQVDPGFIALNYAWNQGFLQVGQSALNLLEPNADVSSLYRSRYSNLNLDDLPEDSWRFFRGMVGMV